MDVACLDSKRAVAVSVPFVAGAFLSAGSTITHSCTLAMRQAILRMRTQQRCNSDSRSLAGREKEGGFSVLASSAVQGRSGAGVGLACNKFKSIREDRGQF